MNNRLKTSLISLLIMTITAVTCGCGSDSGTEQTTETGEGTFTESGYEYRADVYDDRAYEPQ